MGLLDRAGTIEKHSNSTGHDRKELARRILDDGPIPAAGPDYPGWVFEIFARVLGFSKAALMLLNENRTEYSPWITKGFDRTTVRRLLLPVDSTNFENGPVYFLSESQKKKLEPRLSTREYGLNKRILFVGIGNQETPTGIILATGFRDTGDSDTNITEAATILSGSLAADLIKSRAWTAAIPDNSEGSLSEWLEARGDQESIIAILDFSEILQQLDNSIPGLDPYQAQRDLVNILRNFTGRMGRLRQIDSHHAAILFPRGRLIDQDLFLHQLNHALSTAFTRLNRSKAITAVFHNWPEERETVETILSGYL